jgi:hypothetical protein
VLASGLPARLAPFEAPRRCPPPANGIRARFAHVLPPTVVGLVDVEAQDVVVIVDGMGGRSTHGLDGFGFILGSASQGELVVAGSGERVEDAAVVPSEVAPLRGPVADGDEELTVGQDRHDWVQSWTAVGPCRREVRQSVLVEEASTCCGGLDIEDWRRKARTLRPPLTITKIGAEVWARK